MNTYGKVAFATMLWALLAGCAANDGNTDMEEESQANEGENQAPLAVAAALKKTLYYEGACWWLKCANGNDAKGACGYGCSDSKARFARDYESRASCGKVVKVTANGKSVNAKVWDQSCCGRMEGTDKMLDALAIPHGDGTCRGKGDFTYGHGQDSAKFYF
ncbi:RlpA-like double-psi beta-barrel domain-containing protein [Pendulispora rubella]|uniref:RlpA-like double-psi beta-barrel domain-containing protein n=1 Tax=Pendulispora rubella TaxID=2741070 RepID=A0ABZ2L9S5_9BACT